MTQPTERVIAYIDGFNLYYGLLDAGLQNLKWLNIDALIRDLLKPTQELVEIKYFTTIVNSDHAKTKRQRTFIEALESTGVQVIYGSFKNVDVECKRCGNLWLKRNEKMTDVNIASHILADAFTDRYDAAMLISGDSDLTTPINVVHSNFNSKRVFIVFPPSRSNISLTKIARGSMMLGKAKIRTNQFPDVVVSKNGFNLSKPTEWV